MNCKYLNKCFAAILVLIYTFRQVDGFEVTCEYHDFVGYGYGCIVIEGSIENKNESTVKNINGEHLDSQSNKNVSWVSVESKDFLFFPKGLSTFFPKIDTIFIVKSKLQEIQKDDFNGLKNIENLYLDDNSIEYVDAQAFDNLTRLRTLSFKQNTCHSASAHFDRDKVVNVIKEVISKCSKIKEKEKIEETEEEEKTEETVEEGIEISTEFQSTADIVTTERIKNERREVQLEENLISNISLEELQTELKMEKERNIKLSLDIEKLNSKYVKIVDDNDKLQIKLARCDDNTNILTENINLRSELTKRNKEMANLKAENANLNSRVIRCDTDSSALKFQFATQKSENSNLKTKITQCETQMANSLLENENIKNGLTRCKSQITEVEENVEKSKLELSNCKKEQLELQEELLILKSSSDDHRKNDLEIEAITKKLSNCETTLSEQKIENEAQKSCA